MAYKSYVSKSCEETCNLQKHSVWTRAHTTSMHFLLSLWGGLTSMTGRPGWFLTCIEVGCWAIDGSGSALGRAPADLDPGWSRF